MKELNIIGNGDGWEDAPIEGESWLMNGGIMRRSGSRLFLMDAHQKTPKYLMDGLVEFQKKAKELGVPVWCLYRPMADRIYPAMAIVHTWKDLTASGSFDWCMALAIFECYEKINVYGVHLKDGLYKNMKVYGDTWVTRAIDMGIEITGYKLGE